MSEFRLLRQRVKCVIWETRYSVLRYSGTCESHWEYEAAIWSHLDMATNVIKCDPIRLSFLCLVSFLSRYSTIYTICSNLKIRTHSCSASTFQEVYGRLVAALDSKTFQRLLSRGLPRRRQRCGRRNWLRKLQIQVRIPTLIVLFLMIPKWKEGNRPDGWKKIP